jgi:DNA-directed RNA polymerase specialized sigma24 family protein
MSDHRVQATERPLAASSHGEMVAMLRLALDGLPMHQQTAIRLAVVDRLTLTEIASQLGRSPADVRDAMREGLLTLRNVLDVVDGSPTVESAALDA